MRMEKNPVPETSCFLVPRKPDDEKKSKKNSNSERKRCLISGASVDTTFNEV
jgi:hypothetical protein